jgi:hypothetical protein
MSVDRASRRAAILGQSGKLDTEPATMVWADGTTVDVLVTEMTGTQTRDYEIAMAKNAPNVVGFLLQLVLLDPDDKQPLFEAGDRATLQELGMEKLTPVIKQALRLSGMDEAEMAKVKDRLVRGQPNGSIS